ncbi:MAG: hypothetical protein ACO4AI_14015, partial [Prochlorothrix sp.]
FTRSGATTSALSVNYSIGGTADSTDYSGATPGTGKTITFAAGSSIATLTIDPTADPTVEPDETVALTLASGTGYTVGTTTAVTGTILDDDDVASGDVQSITSSDTLFVIPGNTIEIPLIYNTSTGDNTLPGIGVRLHYNASDLTYQTVANPLTTSLFGEFTDLPDTNDLDNDPQTDRYLQFQYVDFAGNWPNQPLPLKLGDVSFLASETFTESTQLNLTGIDGAIATGYNFQGDSLLVREQSWNLDVDGNGTIGALSDGIMAVRYLFGAAFAGDALIDGAIAADATRDLAGVQDYLAGLTTIV